jgi:hypothetical protein
MTRLTDALFGGFFFYRLDAFLKDTAGMWQHSVVVYPVAGYMIATTIKI